MTRRCFFSFHYQEDSWRVGQIRSIGKIERNVPTTPNDWERIKLGGDSAIKKWINAQLDRRTCTVVLIGTHTSKRHWVKYEIVESWKRGMGVVGVYIHGLKDSSGKIARKGANPFFSIKKKTDSSRMSDVVDCFNPVGRNSNERYAWISENLEAIVENAIHVRKVTR